jgi:hypothetical protein
LSVPGILLLVEASLGLENFLQDKAKKHSEREGGIFRSVREFLFGMILHEPAMVALQEKANLERLLFLVTFGGMLGVPVFPPYFSLRLLPHVFPRIEQWKRAMLREKDWTDKGFD